MNGWEAAVEIVQSWPIWISIWLGIAIWKRPAIERLVLSSDPAWADEPLESFTEAWLGLDDAGGRAAAFGRRTPFGQAMLNTWRELNSHHPESVVVMRSPTDLDIVAARELGWI